MLSIQHSLGGIGNVTSNQSICVFRVRKLKELLELVKFFDKYSLISRKRADYLLFKQIVSLIELKQHLRRFTKDYKHKSNLKLWFIQRITINVP